MDPNSSSNRPDSNANPDAGSTANPGSSAGGGGSGQSSQSGQQPAQVVYLQAAPGPARRWFSWLGWLAFFFALSALAGLSAQYKQYFDTTGGIQEKFYWGKQGATDKIAVVDVSGVIGTENTYVKKQIDRARKDDSVKAVVVRVDSPGGTITGSDYILHHLNKLREERDVPLVVSMGSVAASGGYYVSMAVGDQEDSIFAEPTTTTGSIGVIIPHYDLSGLLERYDIKDDSLASHPRKRMLSMTQPISEDDRKVLERYLQDAFERFKKVVKSGRPALRQDESQLEELATGEIFAAERAQENGLVDRLGFVEDAVERAAELAGLAEDGYAVVRYRSPLTFLDALTAVRAPSRPALDLKSILDWGVPKAYYLTTSIPAIATWDSNLSVAD